MKIISKIKSLCITPFGLGTSHKISQYITTQQQLNDLIALMRNSKVVAIDTEFTRQTTYFPVLSIIQVAVNVTPRKKEFFIVDYLCDLDLSDFFALMNQQDLVKIIHSSSQDMQILHHESGLVPSGIMDTQIMANICGVGFNIGYSGLVQKFCGKKIDKKQQNSDWQQRPLHKKQITYALSDVLHLEEIHDQLLEMLNRKARVEWYFEEIKNFTQKSLFRSDEYLTRKISLKGRTPRQIFQIKNIISWREKNAKELNVPRQHLLRDETIEKIILTADGNYRFPKRFTRKMSDEVLQILNKEEDDQQFENRRHVMTDSQKKNYEAARKIIHKIAAEENIESQFLISAPELKHIITNPDSLNEKVSGWRYQMFGQELENLLN